MSSDDELPQGWLRYELDEAALFTAARDAIADDLRNVIEQAQNQARAQAFREAAKYVGKWRDEERKEGRMEANAFGGFLQSHFAALAEQAEKGQ